MLTPTIELLSQAQANRYAVGAFNVYNLEGVKAVIQAAERLNSPVILQIHPKALDHGGLPLIALSRQAASDAIVPAAVHLDHSTSPRVIKMALDAGVSSIMADGSHLDYDSNVAFTREMSALAHSQNAAIEAELGRISGTEDGLTVSEIEARMTDPDKAASFVEHTSVDALAVCVGNVHGAYPGEPMIDFELLAQINTQVDIPLVLHGTSGLPGSIIRRAIQLGVCKFNINTAIRMAYIKAATSYLTSTDKPDLLPLMGEAVAAMQTIVESNIKILGSGLS